MATRRARSSPCSRTCTSIWGPQVAPSGCATVTARPHARQARGEPSGVDRRDRAVGAVGPYDGMQMHDATALELGHPAEGEPDRPTCVGLRATEHDGELALGVDHRATPQLGRAGRSGALRPRSRSNRGKGSADQLVSLLVATRSTSAGAVRTAGPRIDGMTRRGSALRRVDRAEARSRQRQEDGRMQGNRLVHALSAFEPGPDEVAGIPPVDGGA